ncbi:MAG: hypothetical protein EXQ96_04685 [Alphaproteobacteria bacterium]|nr:hypothetical protein [Alphaproteobacteria bacterium]
MARKHHFYYANKRLLIDVPVGTLDINKLGLVAADNRGRRYLCRQKLKNTDRTTLVKDEKFHKNGCGPDYPKFSVPGNISTRSSTRTYHAVIPLDEEPESITKSIENMLRFVA